MVNDGMSGYREKASDEEDELRDELRRAIEVKGPGDATEGILNI